MPIVTITLSEQVGSDFILAAADSIHQALVAAGFPEADRFQRILALGPEHFRYDTTYPNLGTPRSNRFMLIEILFSAPRSIAFKEGLLLQIASHLRRSLELNPEDMMVVFAEAGCENVAITGDTKLIVHDAL